MTAWSAKPWRVALEVALIPFPSAARLCQIDDRSGWCCMDPEQHLRFVFWETSHLDRCAFLMASILLPETLFVWIVEMQVRMLLRISIQHWTLTNPYLPVNRAIACAPLSERVDVGWMWWQLGLSDTNLLKPNVILFIICLIYQLTVTKYNNK